MRGIPNSTQRRHASLYRRICRLGRKPRFNTDTKLLHEAINLELKATTTLIHVHDILIWRRRNNNECIERILNTLTRDIQRPLMEKCTP